MIRRSLEGVERFVSVFGLLMFPRVASGATDKKQTRSSVDGFEFPTPCACAGFKKSRPHNNSLVVSVIREGMEMKVNVPWQCLSR